MKLITSPSDHCLLLVWRTDSLFYTPKRRRLSGEWNQVRFTSVPAPDQASLINHPLDQPLPLADELFDAIYSFYVVEHLSPAANERYVRDMYRLLKPGGIHRVSTPNLEFLATEYLQRLNEQAASASTENYARYRWAVCNLIDQCVREVSGGEILEAIRRGEYTPEYVKHINGDSFDFLFQPVPAASAPASASAAAEMAKKPLGLVRKVLQPIRRRSRPDFPQKSLMELSHERNLWLWDRISLARLCSGAGFRNVTVADYHTSRIPDWNRYNFDESAFGDYPLEPSLFMEGTK